MEKVTVTTLRQIEELGSALTIEGLAEDAFQDFIDWVKQYTTLKREMLFITKGKTMNKLYDLSGSNMYQDDCNIVSIKLSDMENCMAVSLPRFLIGGRWLDDIIDNNVRKEKEKKKRESK